MRRETLIGVGFLLAAVAEIQWATTFLRDGGTMLPALLTFAAGAGCLLVAFGFILLGEAAWARVLGLSVAALAHVAYFFATLDWGHSMPFPWTYGLNAAALLVGLGLALAAWSARGAARKMMRAGLALAALGGVVWTLTDLQSGDMGYMVGNVFATIGFGLAAWYAAE